MSEPLKYYWVLYKENDYRRECCIDMHPFTYIDKLTRIPQYEGAMKFYYLDDWKRIEVEEYNLWRELNNAN